jgi:hypothetical protein
MTDSQRKRPRCLIIPTALIEPKPDVIVDFSALPSRVSRRGIDGFVYRREQSIRRKN